MPFAISGHNNFYLWGPYGYTGEVLIVVNSASLSEMQQFYNSVQVAGHANHPYSMPYEHRTIYIARGRKLNLTKDWKSFKSYD